MGTTHFVVAKDRLREHRLIEEPPAEPSPGSIELSVDRFGLTANNVTYGVMGKALAYWDFFPTSEEGWGILPVWGFGTVTRSALPDVAVGERFYGYFPMSTHVVLEPKRISTSGFLDGATHRRALSSVYNQYLRTTHDALYRADTEREQAVLRPLLATAYFLADFFAEHAFFGAEDILVSSASSKLAYATAGILRDHPQRDGRRVVGLTSARNADFVRELGGFDDVVRYEDVPQLATDRRAVFLDIAGSDDLRVAVHSRLGDALVHSSSIGAAHWDGLAQERDLPGPRPVFFFTPDWVERRTADWGAAGVQERLAVAWTTLLVGIAERPWLAFTEGTGPEAVAARYDDLVAGRTHPRDGHVLSLGGGHV